MTGMKVIRYYPPGGAAKLQYETEEIPSKPADGEVLISVRAVGLIWTELFWPIYQNDDGSYKTHIPCHDFSGVVKTVGSGVENVTVGSELYAFTTKRNHEGALAEYAKADADQVILKPSNLSFEEAASVPLSALTAWQALFDHGNLKAGQKLLVTAAAGGTGIFAVQFGLMIGAHVIGTGSSQRSREILEDFGIDEFVDYKDNNIDEVVQDVDLILDCVGGQALEQCLKVVKKDGLVISINTFDCKDKAELAGVKGMFFIVTMIPEQLLKITQLFEEGKIRAIVDSVFPLEESQKAWEAASAGHVHGKVVIRVPSKRE